MTEHQPNNTEQILDRYLDPALNDAERELLRRQIDAHPELLTALDQQSRVNAALKRLFPDPADAATADRVMIAAMESTKRRRRFGILRIAALIAITTVAIWRLWVFVDPPRVDPYANMNWRSMTTVYRDVAEAGFGDGMRPFNPEKFSRYVKSRFGQDVRISPQTEPVRTMGHGFCNTITMQTMCLITRVPAPQDNAANPDGEVGVLVFVDNADADPAPALPAKSNLNVFKRTLGRLALYEVSPLDRPHALDLLQPADSP